MAGTRLPGVFGLSDLIGLLYSHGPAGRFSCQAHDIMALKVTQGVTGTNSDGGAAAVDAVKAAANVDENELKLLIKVYGNLRNKSGNRTYSYWKKKSLQYRVDEYVQDRNAFFGSAKAYIEFKNASHDELEANQKKLRKYIEPPPGTRRKHDDWEQAQDVFYAWVRKGIKGQVGEDTNVPNLIYAQMSEKLEKALKQVRSDYGKAFKAGGFNPRPMKLSGNYRLGTLSEHALGKAIDIDPDNNAQIEAATWGYILKFTGKSLNHATRTAKWKTKPQELHAEIKAINDAFVEKLKRVMGEVVANAKWLADAKTATAEQKADYARIAKDPLAAAAAVDENLKKIGIKFLKTWQGGFMNLQWELLKELHEDNFVWGATFDSPDIHHFEL